MDMLAKFNLPGILLLFTLAFGVWLSLTGRPYNGLLFNAHKLIALAAVILTVIQFSGVLKSVEATWLIIALLVVSALCVVALFASGALMSAGKLDYAFMLTIHRIALAILILAAVSLASLFLRKA